MKKWIPVFIGLLALPGVAGADEGILLQRIVALEQHVEELEAKLAPVLEQERIKDVVKQQQTLARERIMMDAEIHQRHDLNIIEKLYQTANQDWKSEDARKAVALLTERYPRANRTGCAVLTLAQSTAGNEQLELLNKAIGPFGNSRYANGVQVAPYARLYLAMRHKKEGKDKEAAKLFEEIRTTYPNAIDHKGKLLTTHLEGME
jgi:TolA-binding protein